MVDPQVKLTERSNLRRKRERGSHERASIDAILDEGLICHVGFSEGGSTFVLPTTYARVDDDVFLHGATGNRMLKALGSGSQACLAVTLLDGLVFARSAFHHSMNFRSVMLFGSCARVDDAGMKRDAVFAILDHMTAGRSRDARPPTAGELRSTTVVRFPIEEGSAKIRMGGPIEDPDDLELPIWAGELPIEMLTKSAIPDDHVPIDVGLPGYVADYPDRKATLFTEAGRFVEVSPTGDHEAGG